MGLISITGQPGCRVEEIARIAGNLLRFELVTTAKLAALIPEEFGPAARVPASAYGDVVSSIIGPLATEHHLILCDDGAEWVVRDYPGTLRVHVVAPESVRAGNVMVDRRLDKTAARTGLRQMETSRKVLLKARFGRTTLPSHLLDVIFNCEALPPEHVAELIAETARKMGIEERGYLSAAAEAQLQFRVRLRLARHGLVPPGRVGLPRKSFAHASEEIFANLLDFYRIAWEYEPRSFPIQFGPDGRVSESFTPDFHLPEFNLYVELTTMKQSLVTRKNRKIKLLRELYPHIDIRVFYQKDIENLIFKYGLAERAGKP